MNLVEPIRSVLFINLPVIILVAIILPWLMYSSYRLGWLITKSLLRAYSHLFLRPRNHRHRASLLSTIGVHEGGSSSTKLLLIGFFHPYCHAGGGGERVLWTALAFHQATQPHSICAIYTGDLDVSKPQIIQRVKQRFGIDLNPSKMILVPLKTRYLVEAVTWPRFTLLGQSLGSIVMGYEALSALIPDIYIDTMGYAFTFPVFRLLSDVPIGAYVHYPTISSDMLQRVSQRSSAHNNSSTISKSIVLSYGKLVYYIIFAKIYSLCLRQADHLMVNSTWTKNHVDRLLKPYFHRDNIKSEGAQSTLIQSPTTLSKPATLRLRTPSSSIASHIDPDDRERFKKDRPARFGKVAVVFPPCDVDSFKDFPLVSRAPKILSISQFRPEKDQKTQIEAFGEFLSSISSEDPRRSRFKLVLAGSCRDRSDEARVEELKKLSKELGIADSVEFKVNIGWDELKELLKDSYVGLSTMLDEHFGISIVEFMASGLIPLVHRSGGPLLDIVVPFQDDQGECLTGFHAHGVHEYSQQLLKIFEGLDDHQTFRIRQAARQLSSQKFNVQAFERSWSESFDILLQKRS